MWRVIKYFTDLQDGEHPYNVGDVFPREGLEVSGDRLLELSTAANKRGIPLIEKVGEPIAQADEPAAPKKRGRKAKT